MESTEKRFRKRKRLIKALKEQQMTEEELEEMQKKNILL